MSQIPGRQTSRLFNLGFGAGGAVRWADLPDADGNGAKFDVVGDCHVACGTASCALELD